MPEFRFPGPAAFQVALKLAGGSHEVFVDVAALCRRLEQEGYALSYRHKIAILICACAKDGGPFFEVVFQGERVLVRFVKQQTLEDETEETLRAVHAPNAVTRWRTLRFINGQAMLSAVRVFERHQSVRSARLRPPHLQL